MDQRFRPLGADLLAGLRASLVQFESLIDLLDEQINEVMLNAEQARRTREQQFESDPALEELDAGFQRMLDALELQAGQARRSRDFLRSQIRRMEGRPEAGSPDDGGDGASAGAAAAAAEVDVGPTAREAVLRVLRRSDGMPVRVRDIVEEIQRHGWLQHSADPRNAVTSALHRLSRDPRAPVAAAGRGHFRYTG